MNLESFLTLILDSAPTCFTSSPHETGVQEKPAASDLYFSINKLHPTKDLQPSQPWHSPDKPRRADCNVLEYRNFLIELDAVSLEDQLTYVRSKIPVSSIVYSGGRSYHFIISLDTPLPNLAAYKSAASRLLALLPDADSSCRNPSRLSRLPFRLRPDTGKEQTLVYLGERINWQKLDSVLPLIPMRTYTPLASSSATPLVMEAALAPDETIRVKNLGGRNAFFFYLGQRMIDAGLNADQKAHFVDLAYKNLKDTSGFSYSEACMAARIEE